MNCLKCVCVFVASMMIAGSVVAWAQNEPTTKPSDNGLDHQDPKAVARSSSGRWGFAPYNRLTSATEEQKQKISEIRRRMNAERKAIDEREEAEVMAVLTEEQKAELAQIEADRKAEAAKKRAEKKQEKQDGEKEEKDK